MVHLLPGLQRLDGVDVGAGERAAAAMQFTTDEAYTLECVHRALIPPCSTASHGVTRLRTASRLRCWRVFVLGEGFIVPSAALLLLLLLL